MTRVDLPPPDTPVMQVSVPSGICAVTFFRLLPLRADDFEPAIVHGFAPLGGKRNLLQPDEIFSRQALRDCA